MSYRNYPSRFARAKAIFGPGTPIPACAREIIKQIRAARAGSA